MNAIYKSFITETYEFQNKRSADVMMADIRKFCQDNSGFYYHNFLPGDGRETYQFRFERQQYSGNEGATIKGRVLPLGNGCLVQIKLKPNYFLILIALGFMVWGIITLSQAVNANNLQGGILQAFALTIAVPAIIVWGISSSKTKLLENFKKAFDL